MRREEYLQGEGGGNSDRLKEELSYLFYRHSKVTLRVCNLTQRDSGQTLTHLRKAAP